MSAGPAEYVIIGFPGNEFNGEIVPELAGLVDAGLIRIVDLIFVSKDAEGQLLVVEVDEHEDVTMFASLDGEVSGVLSTEDIEHAAEAIEPGWSILMVLWEDVWAQPLAQAIRDSGGVLLEGARIPDDLYEDVERVLADAS
jgi:uncharacterized membrane protein